MAEDNTVLIVIGVAALAFMGFLYWKSTQQGTNTLQPRTTLTEFVRDKDGRILQILER